MNKLQHIIPLLAFCLGMAIAPAGMQAQCGQQLVEQAAELAGTDAVFIRDFKVKLPQGNMDTPTPTGKFSVYLNEGVNYRFTLANASNFEGKAFFELGRNGQKYIDNFSSPPSSPYLSSVDFACPRSATYQLRVHFGQGKEGCSAVVLSLVYNDSMAYIEPGIPLKSDSSEVIYLWTEHPVQIASSESRHARFKLTLSQGSYEKQGKYYLIRPEHAGDLQVKVEVFENGRFIESDSVNYRVEPPPLPRLSFTHNAYSISKSLVGATSGIRLIYPYTPDSSPYTLKSFYIANNSSGFNKEASAGDKLSVRQLKIIKATPVNQSIYILNAEFIDPRGNIHRKETLEMMVQE